MNIPEHLQGLAHDVLAAELQAAERSALWSVVLGLKPEKIHDKWYVRCGSLEASGNTPAEAMYRFNHLMDCN